MGFDLLDNAFLLVAAFFAGLIDSAVGGGGLVQIPALFTVMPQAAPATVFGTNKLSSVFGTLSATWRYTRHITIPWSTALPAALAALAFSWLGALAVVWLPKEWMRPLVLVLLVAVAAYTYARKDFGSSHAPRLSGRRELVFAALVGAGLGFYDGFFGPGTGSFLIFIFVRAFGFDFLRASAAAKVVNVATNTGALVSFSLGGYVLAGLGFGMAVLNVAGAFVGTHLALRHGSAFVRKLFLVVVGTFILKFAIDLFLPR